MNIPIFFVHLLLLATTLTTAQLLLRTAIARSSGDNYIDLLQSQWHLVLGALALFGANFFYYILALQRTAIAVLYPAYTTLTLVLVFLAGVLVFRETVSTQQVAGLALLCLGIFLIQPG